MEGVNREKNLSKKKNRVSRLKSGWTLMIYLIIRKVRV